MLEDEFTMWMRRILPLTKGRIFHVNSPKKQQAETHCYSQWWERNDISMVIQLTNRYTISRKKLIVDCFYFVILLLITKKKRKNSFHSKQVKRKIIGEKNVRINWCRERLYVPFALGAHNFCVASFNALASFAVNFAVVPSSRRFGSVNLIPFFWTPSRKHFASRRVFHERAVIHNLLQTTPPLASCRSKLIPRPSANGNCEESTNSVGVFNCLYESVTWTLTLQPLATAPICFR